MTRHTGAILVMLNIRNLVKFCKTIVFCEINHKVLTFGVGRGGGAKKYVKDEKSSTFQGG